MKGMESTEKEFLASHCSGAGAGIQEPELEPVGRAGEGDCSENEGPGVLLRGYRGYLRKGLLFSDGEVTGDFWQWFQ